MWWAEPESMTTVRCGIALVTIVILVAGCTAPNIKTQCFDSVTVQGTPQFCDQVVSALDLLKTKSPSSYIILTDNVGIIQQGKRSGMKADKWPPVFELNDRSAFYSITWCAGVIAHDSFHSKLFHDYRKAHHFFVPGEVWAGHLPETKCLAHQLQALTEIGAPEDELRYCRTLTPIYADVPYRKRNW
ncbi:MAG: hypothetical protein OEW04_15495 [Nitrospirota bacterium]|nr:hypothetical protein [Nitrospirota bacterium]